MIISLPFPPASLSGHNKGYWRDKTDVVARHREWARKAVEAERPSAAADGDIVVEVTFYPPDRRGDRVNFPNRMKPYFDGIADALKVNDRRFLPRFLFGETRKPGSVEIVL